MFHLHPSPKCASTVLAFCASLLEHSCEPGLLQLPQPPDVLVITQLARESVWCREGLGHNALTPSELQNLHPFSMVLVPRDRFLYWALHSFNVMLGYLSLSKKHTLVLLPFGWPHNSNTLDSVLLCPLPSYISAPTPFPPLCLEYLQVDRGTAESAPLRWQLNRHCPVAHPSLGFMSLSCVVFHIMYCPMVC